MSFAQMGVVVSGKKAKEAVEKEAKIQSKHIYQCVNPKVGLEPNAASLNYMFSFVTVDIWFS